MQLRYALALVLATADAHSFLGAQSVTPSVPGRHRIEVRSTADSSLQPSYLSIPAALTAPTPLAVLLHTWSFDLEQRDTTVEAEARNRGWLLLSPNFRGRNDHPEACGSRLAQQDILDAVAWIRRHYPVDANRIYVLGMSGGGFMTMLTAARNPDLWAGASAWVGISDLRSWYDAHAHDQFGDMMRRCFGGQPSASDGIASEYRIRSPMTYISPATSVPLDLAAGRFDSVVVASHTLLAFRALAPGALTSDELGALTTRDGKLVSLTPADTVSDALLGRRIFLRRTAGRSRVTIFDGGHEWMPRAAMAWLAEQRRR